MLGGITFESTLSAVYSSRYSDIMPVPRVNAEIHVLHSRLVNVSANSSALSEIESMIASHNPNFSALNIECAVIITWQIIGSNVRDK